MPQIFNQWVQIQGRLVGYSLAWRKDRRIWIVRFIGPTSQYVKRSTGVEKKSEAQKLAEKIIHQEYGATPVGNRVTWDEAEERLRNKLIEKNRRSSSMKKYISQLHIIRDAFPGAVGPADVDESMVEQWVSEYSTGRFKRSKAKDGKTFARSANTIYSCLQSLSSLWNRWLIEELAVVCKNPFAKITLPKLDKPTVRYATDEQMAHFFDWLESRFEGWELPDLFFTIKAYTGCRLFDLCSVRSNQLHENTIFFPAGIQKARKDRRVPLPKDLFERLNAIKGSTFLWERYPVDVKAICQQKGWPSHQLRPDFDPGRMSQWIEDLMTNYRRENPDQPRLTTHMLRKRAMTQSWEAKIDPRKAAIAFGVAVDTMMKHYVKLDEQATTDEVFGQLHGLE